MATTLERLPQTHVPATAGIGASHDRTLLYRIAGGAAAVAALLTPISVGVFTRWPPPYDGSALEWFELYRDNALLGLLSLDLAFLVISALIVPVMVGLYVALRDVRPSRLAIGGILYLVAAAAYFGTNTSFEMLTLSERYFDATTETQRVALLGAGEAMLATFDGTAFHVYYFLGQLAGIIFGTVMLRSDIFSRRLAYLMIFGNAFGFLLYVPVVGLALSAFSGVILWFWMIAVARRFVQLARDA